MTSRYDLDKHPEMMRIHDLPVINTPFTRMCETWGTNQSGVCAAYELDFIRCAERVGARRMDNECRKLYYDFQECRFKQKSVRQIYNIEKLQKLKAAVFLMS